MQSNLSQFQRSQLTLITRVSPSAMAGHLLNTIVLAVALAGSVPLAELIIWFIYSCLIALFLLYRHVKNHGRTPRSFQRAAKKAMIYSFFLALPWSSLVVLHLGALSHDQELIMVALAVGMAATGTILLSAVPPAALVYMSGILIPSALKCVVLDQKGYLLLGTLALSCWGFLAALIAKITRDIRERERAEQAIAEHNMQRALAEKAALVGSFAYDTDTERMEISPGYAAIHGFPEWTAEIMRNEWMVHLHPEDAERLQVLRSLAFSERRREYNIDYRIVRSGGELRWIDSRSFIGYDDDGHAQRVIGVNIDITERKLAEEHRKLLNARLSAQWTRLQRANAFKSEMLGTVAHNLKNPLGVILGRTEMLAEMVSAAASGDAIKAQIGHIRSAAHRVTEIIDSLISDAMADAHDITIRREPVDLVALLRDLVDANQPLAARKDQTITLTAPAAIDSLCDSDRIREAIDNLLSNAIKYSQIGGRIEVGVDRRGESAVIRVSDEGPGLSPEDTARLFGRFQRLSAKPTGGETSTGLGLSIVKRIVDLHGGTVTAQTTGSSGTTFMIAIPST